MSKPEELKIQRKASEISSIADSVIVTGGKRGRPKEDRETKKRISLSVFPSLYGDIQKIAYIQRKSVSELVALIMEEYKRNHEEDLAEYEKLKKL